MQGADTPSTEGIVALRVISKQKPYCSVLDTEAEAEAEGMLSSEQINLSQNRTLQ
jgi:hypothetical protein